MDTPEEDLIASLLVADEPQRQAGRLLELLVNRTKARGGAVISARTRPPSMFVVSSTLDLVALGELSAAWPRVETRLAVGEDALVGEGRAVPLAVEGALVGAVYLVGAAAFDAEVVRSYQVPLARAIRADEKLDRPAMDGVTRGRQELQRLLDGHAGNVSRVARALGVTRRTIYLRMEKFGIAVRRPRGKAPA